MLKLDDVDPALQYDARHWPELKQRVAKTIQQKTRAEWQNLLEGTDVCFAPVLSLTEAADHPHNKSRELLVDVNGQMQPAPAPRYSRSTLRKPSPGALCGEHTQEVLAELGIQRTSTSEPTRLNGL